LKSVIRMTGKAREIFPLFRAFVSHHGDISLGRLLHHGDISLGRLLAKPGENGHRGGYAIALTRPPRM